MYGKNGTGIRAGSTVAVRIRVTKGLNIPIGGEPEQAVNPSAPVSRVALIGLDYPGLKPRLLVAEGDPVTPKQALFVDKRDPAVHYCAPGRGTVVAINRGPRRVLHSVVVGLEDDESEEILFEPLDVQQSSRLGRADLVERLVQSGLWTSLRTRPFSQVPHSGSVPRAIFVTAMDTRPLAPDPMVAIRADSADFSAGLEILSRLTDGALNLCTARGWDIDIPEIDSMRVVRFSGPHPAGLVGTHIHHLHPVNMERVVWHIGYQDVIAVGKLFRTGVIDQKRIVALGGNRVKKPRLVSTRVGASIDQLMRKEIRDPENCRIISGSVLGGRTASENLAYLGRYHDEVSVIREGGSSFLFGWTGLFPRRYSAAKTLLRKTGQRRKLSFSTAQNGRYTGMLPMRAFEKVMPLDILQSPMFRALLVKDTDQAQALGCLELDEEDLALCSFLCPAKVDYGTFLRMNLNQIEREG